MDLVELGFVSITAITIICYLIGMGIKLSPIRNEFIPIICPIFGVILAFVQWAFDPATGGGNPLNVIAIGIISGGGATWVNQMIKQLGSSNKE